MSLLANSANVSQSPENFNCLLTFKSLLFCCFKQNNSESVDGISNAGVISATDIPEVESANNDDISQNDIISKKQEEIFEAENEEINEGNNKEEEVSHEDIIVDMEDMETISDEENNAATVAIVVGSTAERKKTSELRFRLVYDSENKSLLITVIDAYDLARPSSSMSSVREHVINDVPAVLAYSVHILVLPLRKLRYKTKMRQGPDPYFDEVIKIPKINEEEVKTWSLRFRLYGSMRTSMKQVLGEGYLVLEAISFNVKTEYRIALLNYDSSVKEDVTNIIISATKWKQESLTSLEAIDKLTSLIEAGAGPELMIGLSYNSSTGRLTIDVIKGNKFPKIKENKQPDTLISIILTSGKGEEMAHSKTVIQRCTCEPIFEEKFIFQVLLFQLEEVKLTISGCHKKSLGKISTFGYFEMGSSNSTEEELNHWKDMTSSVCGEQILRWHNFQPKEKK